MLLPFLLVGLLVIPDSFRDMGLDMPTVPFVVIVMGLILLIMRRAEATRQVVHRRGRFEGSSGCRQLKGTWTVEVIASCSRG